MGSQPEQLDETIRNVLSDQCKVRQQASVAFIKNADVTSLSRVREELQKKSPTATAYLKDALEFLEAKQMAEAKSQAIIRKGIEEVSATIPDTAENQTKIAKAFSNFLLKEMRGESLTTQMMLVGYLADRATHYSGEPEEMPFRSTLELLLSGSDQRLRAFAAASLLVKRLKEKQALISILLRGLEHEDFTVRYISWSTLVSAGAPETCFNPLDPVRQRQQALVALKRWWKEESSAQTKQRKGER
jgi:hypothetical protein